MKKTLTHCLIFTVGLLLGGWYFTLHPNFWSNTLKVKIIDDARYLPVYINRSVNEIAFTKTPAVICYEISDDGFSFRGEIVDKKHMAFNRTFVVCPNHGAGWMGF